MTQPHTTPARAALAARYRVLRAATLRLCAPLAVEDYVVQACAEVSPPKWHLAHTAWFFETFLLGPLLPGYRPFHPDWAYLFNSYYDSVGPRHPRPERGRLSRPTVAEVRRYRDHVDSAMARLFETAQEGQWPEVARRAELGLHHEQQHQELLLTDIKYNFGVNPLQPAYADLPAAAADPAPPPAWQPFPGGDHTIGHRGAGFCFDNELPPHPLRLAPFRLATRPVSNGEYLRFIDDGGYHRPELWLADGWAHARQALWQAPLYWWRDGGTWWQFTLGGARPLAPAEPVCHVSFYEADAYARWAGHRLPEEAEWEVAAGTAPPGGNLREGGRLHPRPATPGPGLRQMAGDVWEWTASPYRPYPGYRRAEGAFGEYNGKFMCNQMVVRGGSCVTPADHLRPSYRNFFYPHDRWQFTGIRLAE